MSRDAEPELRLPDGDGGRRARREQDQQLCDGNTLTDLRERRQAAGVNEPVVRDEPVGDHVCSLSCG